MIFKLKQTRAATNDIDEIVDWYNKIDIELSLKFEFSLIESIEFILKNPLLFQLRYNDIRVHFVENFPYGIHYKIIKDEIIIVAIFHTSRSPQNWIKRTKK